MYQVKLVTRPHYCIIPETFKCLGWEEEQVTLLPTGVYWCCKSIYAGVEWIIVFNKKSIWFFDDYQASVLKRKCVIDGTEPGGRNHWIDTFENKHWKMI